MLLLGFLFLCVYLHRILVAIRSHFEIHKGIKLLEQFIFAYEHRRLSPIRNGSDYHPYLEKLLSYYPRISEYVPLPALSYGRPDGGNYECSKTILNKLKMQRNYFKMQFPKNVNPFTAVFTTLLLPTSFAKKLGFRISDIKSILISVISGVIVDVLTHLITDHLAVCNLINSFFQRIYE